MHFPILFSPILAAEASQAPDSYSKILTGMGTLLVIIFGVVFALQIVAYWLTSKFLAGDGGSFAKGFISWLAHLGITIAGVVVALVFKSRDVMAGYYALLVFTFFLNIWVVAKVHSFGVVRGFVFVVIATVLSAAFFYGTNWVADKNGAMKPLLAFAFGVKQTEIDKAEASLATAEPVYATQQEAQAAALKKYPALGVAGSAFNKAFLEKHTKLKAEGAALLGTPGWPMKVAEEVAKETGTGP